MESAAPSLSMGILLGVVIIVSLTYYIMTKKGVSSSPGGFTAAGPFPLEKQATLVSAEASKAFYVDPEGSIRAFVYLNPMLRTGAHVVCGTGPAQPSCEDGTYSLCSCANGDCTTSCSHVGYVPLLSIAGVFVLENLMAPDASRPASAATQLTVKTEGPPTGSATSNSKYIETLQLPPLPLQKWTMIAISRTGRRLDIFYNDQLVLSKSTQYMPVTAYGDTDGLGITSGGGSASGAGGGGLSGSIMNLQLSSGRISTREIASIYQSNVNTRGEPHGATAQEQTDLLGLLPKVSLGFFDSAIGAINAINPCAGGACIQAPRVTPTNPFYEWYNAP